MQVHSLIILPFSSSASLRSSQSHLAVAGSCFSSLPCCASTTVCRDRWWTGLENWTGLHRVSLPLTPGDYSEFPIMLHVQHRHVAKRNSGAKEWGLFKLAVPPPPKNTGGKKALKTTASHTHCHDEFNKQWLEPALKPQWMLQGMLVWAASSTPGVAGLCETTVQIRLLTCSGVYHHI